MVQDILTFNQGSSSLKFAVFETGTDPSDVDRLALRVRGEVDHIHSAPELCVKDGQHQIIALERWRTEDGGHEAAFKKLLGWLRGHRGAGHLQAVGHRVVHGGSAFTGPVIVDQMVISALERFIPFAPMHQQHNLAGIRVLRAIEPNLLQIACFDTAFHSSVPKIATRFALPREYEAQGVRRYGFHGLSYEYITRELRRVAPALARGRVVAAHLGSGASLCALRNGRSVDMTTGLTTLDGLPMATRCGAIDPGVLLHLMRAKNLSVDDLERLLYCESGLLGLSGTTGSVRDLLASQDVRAMEAIEYFVFRVAREIAALACSLGGLDALVFTGGIGEHAAPVRSWICERLQWMGVRLDEAANARGADILSLPESPVSVKIIPADEERMIAHHAALFVRRGQRPLHRMIA